MTENTAFKDTPSDWQNYIGTYGLQERCRLHMFKEFILPRENKNQLSSLMTQDEPHYLQFYEDEWINKKEIVKSMIIHRSKETIKSVYARECEVRKLVPKEAGLFFDKSHISGRTPSSMSFGLVCDDEIVCAIAFRKPVQKKHGNLIEVSRFASQPFTNVPGGFSKLLKTAVPEVRALGYEGILTYSDLRFGKGLVYKRNGFKYSHNTSQGYWYIHPEKKTRQYRFKYRAEKEPKMTERQVAEREGVYRAYDCGHAIYMLYFEGENKNDKM